MSKKEPTKSPCPSCPFLKDNHAEFGVVAKALCKKFHQPEPDFFQILTIRKRVCDDGIKSERLLCHSHVYDKSMEADVTDAPMCEGLRQHLAANPKPKSKPRKRK